MKQNINDPKTHSFELRRLLKEKNYLEDRISSFTYMYECEKNSGDNVTLNFYKEVIENSKSNLSLVEKEIEKELEKDFVVNDDILKEIISTIEDKYTLQRYMDDGFVVPRKSGYYGEYFIAQIHGKQTLVYLDSNDYKIKFLTDFFDEIQYGVFDNVHHTFPTDTRYNNENVHGVVIVKKNGLYNVLSQSWREKIVLLHTKWFKSMEYVVRGGKKHILAITQDDERVYLDRYGYIMRDNTNLLKLVKSWSKDETLENWVKKGELVVGGHGFQYKGGGTGIIPTNKAIEMFSKYSFGMGFYELSWVEYKGEVALSMREYSENDMY
jgi:hypothetical protein